MATERIAWSLTADRAIALIYPTYQTSNYTGGEMNLVDITVSTTGTVLALGLDDAATKVHFSQEVFPMDWQEFNIDLEEGVNASRCDASPSGELFFIRSDQQLAKLTIPKKGGKAVKSTLVKGGENVVALSAAPDGQVWVVALDPNVGSVVKKMDTKGKWSTIEGIGNAMRVTGTAEGGAYVLTSDGVIHDVPAKGEKGIVPSSFYASIITVGPDNRLWALSSEPQIGGSKVYYTDDNGQNWTPVDNSGAVAIDAGLITSEVGVGA